jgi:hypothetical protein
MLNEIRGFMQPEVTGGAGRSQLKMRRAQYVFLKVLNPMTRGWLPCKSSNAIVRSSRKTYKRNNQQYGRRSTNIRVKRMKFYVYAT